MPYEILEPEAKGYEVLEQGGPSESLLVEETRPTKGARLRSELEAVRGQDSFVRAVGGGPVFAPPPGEADTLREQTAGERLRFSPVGRALLGPSQAERDLMVSGGTPTPLEIVERLPEFTSVPPPIRKPIRAVTDPLIDLLPAPAAGVATGLRETALQLPVALAAARLPGAVGKLVMGLFGGQYLFSIPEQKRAFDAAQQAGDMKGAYSIATQAALGGLLTVAGTRAAFGKALGTAPKAGEARPEPPVPAAAPVEPPPAPETPQAPAPRPEPVPLQPETLSGGARFVRSSEARTPEAVQALFPKAKLTPEQADALLQEAFPETAKPSAPGVPNAVQPSPETPVRNVSPQSGIGQEGKVPVEEVPGGVRGGSSPEGEAGAGSLSVSGLEAELPDWVKEEVRKAATPREAENNLRFFIKVNKEIAAAVEKDGWGVLDETDLRYLTPKQRAVYDAWQKAGKPEGEAGAGALPVVERPRQAETRFKPGEIPGEGVADAELKPLAGGVKSAKAHLPTDLPYPPEGFFEELPNEGLGRFFVIKKGRYRSAGDRHVYSGPDNVSDGQLRMLGFEPPPIEKGKPASEPAAPGAERPLTAAEPALVAAAVPQAAGKVPRLTEAIQRDSQIFLSFDMAGHVPTPLELKEQFAKLGHDVEFLQFEPNVLSTGSGIVKFRGDAFKKEGGGYSSDVAKQAFRDAFGQAEDIRVKSAAEKALPFEERFTKSLRVYARREAGVTVPATERADARAELEETVPAARAETPEPAPVAAAKEGPGMVGMGGATPPSPEPPASGPKPPGITIKPKGGGEAGAIMFPGVPKAVVQTVKKANRQRKAFGALFSARSNRRFMDQTFDGADGLPRILGQQAARSLELAGSKADRQAAIAVIEANGDPRNLNHFLTQSANNPTAQAAVRLALRDWTRLQPLAAKVRSLLDQQIAHEQAADIDTPYREAYVPHLLDMDELMGRGRPYTISWGQGGSGLTTGFMKGRSYTTIFDAIENGEVPRSLDARDLVEHRIRVGQRLINRSKWADGLRKIFDPSDGQPLVKDMVTHQRADGKPFRSPPLGYTPREIIPGVTIAVHEGYAGLFDALTGTSSFSQSLPVRTLLKAEGGVKHGLLLFDTFHASRIMQKELFLTGRVSYKKGYSLLEYSDRDLGEAVKQGHITPEMETWIRQARPTAQLLIKNGLNVGRVAENIAPGFVRSLPGIGHFNRWVFDKVTRGAMLQTGLLEFDRVSKARPDLKPREVALKVARDLNVYYGNLGHQGIFKSSTALDISRLMALAPQWVEGMARTEARGFAQIAKGVTVDPIMHRTFMAGTLARGVGQGLAAYFLGTQLLNLWTRGQPTWKNEESGHKLDAWIPDWSGKGKGAGFFLSPFSVVAELTHDLIRYSHSEPTLIDSAMKIASNKASPLFRALKILATGKIYSGEKLVDPWQRVKAAGWALAPVAIPLQAPIKGTDYPGQTQRQLTASAGFKIEPAPTAQGEIHQLAGQWLARQTDPKLKHEYERRQQQEFGISDYKKLRNALYTGDIGRARAEYDRLRKEDGKAAKDIARVMNPRTADGALKPLIIPHSTEHKFRASLTPAQQAQYRQAQQERIELYRTFRKMLVAP